MNIDAKEGSKVRYTAEAWRGNTFDKEHCQKYLIKDKIYTVERTEVYSYSSTVYLKEIPKQSFNTVMFR